MYLLSTVVLLADAEWLKFIPAIIFFVVWVLNQLFTAGKAKPGAPAERGAPRRVPPPPGNPPRAVQAPQPQLQTEIEEFLKRANQQRERKARQAQQPAPAPPRPRPVQQAPPRRELPIEVEVVEMPRRGDRVGALSEHHMTTRQFDESSTHMADDILEGDRARKQHEDKVFRHNVGKLADTSSGGAGDQSAPAMAAAAAAAAAPGAGEVPTFADLLRNPANLRQAIILNQIFERPTDRW